MKKFKVKNISYEQDYKNYSDALDDYYHWDDPHDTEPSPPPRCYSFKITKEDEEKFSQNIFKISSYYPERNAVHLLYAIHYGHMDTVREILRKSPKSLKAKCEMENNEGNNTYFSFISKICLNSMLSNDDKVELLDIFLKEYYLSIPKEVFDINSIYHSRAIIDFAMDKFNGIMSSAKFYLLKYLSNNDLDSLNIFLNRLDSYYSEFYLKSKLRTDDKDFINKCLKKFCHEIAIDNNYQALDVLSNILSNSNNKSFKKIISGYLSSEINIAIQNHNHEFIECYLNNNLPINENILTNILKSGDVHTLRILFNFNSDIKFSSANIAEFIKYNDDADFLVEVLKIHPDMLENVLTPAIFRLAVKYNNISIVKFLLEMGIESIVPQHNILGESVVSAVKNNNLQMLKVLFQYCKGALNNIGPIDEVDESLVRSKDNKKDLHKSIININGKVSAIIDSDFKGTTVRTFKEVNIFEIAAKNSDDNMMDFLMRNFICDKSIFNLVKLAINDNIGLVDYFLNNFQLVGNDAEEVLCLLIDKKLVSLSKMLLDNWQVIINKDILDSVLKITEQDNNVEILKIILDYHLYNPHILIDYGATYSIINILLESGEKELLKDILTKKIAPNNYLLDKDLVKAYLNVLLDCHKQDDILLMINILDSREDIDMSMDQFLESNSTSSVEFGAYLLDRPLSSDISFLDDAHRDTSVNVFYAFNLVNYLFSSYRGKIYEVVNSYGSSVNYSEDKSIVFTNNILYNLFKLIYTSPNPELFKYLVNKYSGDEFYSIEDRFIAVNNTEYCTDSNTILSNYIITNVLSEFINDFKKMHYSFFKGAKAVYIVKSLLSLLDDYKIDDHDAFSSIRRIFDRKFIDNDHYLDIKGKLIEFSIKLVSDFKIDSWHKYVKELLLVVKDNIPQDREYVIEQIKLSLQEKIKCYDAEQISEISKNIKNIESQLYSCNQDEIDSAEEFVDDNVFEEFASLEDVEIVNNLMGLDSE